MNLEDLGWDSHFNIQLNNFDNKDNLEPARITQEHKGLYMMINASGEYLAEISGRMRYTARGYSDFPAVGDWVLAKIFPGEKKGIIHSVLERETTFSRKAVLSGGMPDSQGKTEEQVIAANINTVFIVTSMDSDFSLRRIERYMTSVYDSNMNPVIVLNKSDIVSDIGDYINQTESIAFGVPVIPVSGLMGAGIDDLRKFIRPGETIVFLGSSGVGKSTIINSLTGTDRQKVNAVRETDQKGRHTTTTRELIILPDGGILIDTPGMREFQPWKSEKETGSAFEDIGVFAQKCRFKDCSHESEPGCAVKEALDNGDLDSGRYKNYMQMKREARYLESRVEKKAELAEKKKWKDIAKLQKQFKKNN
ncbi:MAG: ribosome small subunit-dependent GTPase A [Desulfobacteraceae bacterium]|jgi:ribosome biogenesis GTPase